MIARVICLGVLLAAEAAPAAVVYEPVQYQYQNQYAAGPGPTFYYGGSNPIVFDHMARVGCEQQGSLGSREGAGYYGLLRRDRWNTPPYVFTDCIPWTNAAIYGFSPADARNEASQNAPRYFRKADLLAAGVVRPDGTLVVAAHAQPIPQIIIKPYNSATRPAPRPILIIPKVAPLPQPASGGNPVAAAQ